MSSEVNSYRLEVLTMVVALWQTLLAAAGTGPEPGRQEPWV